MLNEFMTLDRMEQYRQGILKFMQYAEIESVAELARRSGVHFNTINKFLKKKTDDIELGTLAKMAENLGITIGTLIGEITIRESVKQDTEPMSESLKKLLKTEDAKLVQQVLELDTGQKAILSGTLKALPAGRPDGKNKPEVKKDNRKKK